MGGSSMQETRRCQQSASCETIGESHVKAMQRGRGGEIGVGGRPLAAAARRRWKWRRRSDGRSGGSGLRRRTWEERKSAPTGLVSLLCRFRSRNKFDFGLAMRILYPTYLSKIFLIGNSLLEHCVAATLRTVFCEDFLKY